MGSWGFPCSDPPPYHPKGGTRGNPGVPRETGTAHFLFQPTCRDSSWYSFLREKRGVIRVSSVYFQSLLIMNYSPQLLKRNPLGLWGFLPNLRPPNNLGGFFLPHSLKCVSVEGGFDVYFHVLRASWIHIVCRVIMRTPSLESDKKILCHPYSCRVLSSSPLRYFYLPRGDFSGTLAFKRLQDSTFYFPYSLFQKGDLRKTVSYREFIMLVLCKVLEDW